MKKIYLPELRKVEVKNYSLYYQEPSFGFEFKRGISAIIGANGIGKTTFVNIIIYCLVGFKIQNPKKVRSEKNQEINFFSDRVNDAYENNEDAEAFLDFYIKDTSIRIGRSLIRDEITYFEIDKKIHENFTNEEYRKLITQITGITDFDDFEKIIRNFLFFDELRNNIAWEADTQDDILRILLFDEEYFSKFKLLEKKVTELDSYGRHKSEERRMAIKALDELVEEKQKVIINSNNISQEKESKIDLDNLFRSKNNLNEEINNLTSQFNSEISEQKEKRAELDEFIGVRDGVSLQIESLT